MSSRSSLCIVAVAAGLSLVAAAAESSAAAVQPGHKITSPHVVPHVLPPRPGPIRTAPVRPLHWAPTVRFEHHDFRHFTTGERARWVSGHWSHGWHHHRHGWWWFVGGSWFFYPQPIWPYPTYVSTEYVEEVPTQYQGQYWYYCDNPKGYWPYVSDCNGPWEPVPVTPPNEISSDDSE